MTAKAAEIYATKNRILDAVKKNVGDKDTCLGLLGAGSYAAQCEIAAQLADLNEAMRLLADALNAKFARDYGIDRDHPHFHRDHRTDHDDVGEIDALSEALMQGKVEVVEAERPE